jgi:hypothetical protein
MIGNKNMNNYKKVIIVIVLSLLVVGPLLTKPKPVHAFSPGVVAVNGSKWGWERLKDFVGQSWDKMITKVVVNTARMFMNQMAYNLAVNIAEGGSGKSSLYETDPFTDAINKASDAAAGDFLGELTQATGKNGLSLASLGLDLCNPSLEIQLSLTLDVLDSVEPQPPKCNFSNVKENWVNFSKEMKDRKWGEYIQDNLTITPNSKRANFDDTFIALFGYEQTYLGQRDMIIQDLEEQMTAAKLEELATLDKCKGYLDVKETITQEIKTGCVEIMNMKEAQWDAAMAGDSFAFFEESEGGALSAILAEAGNMFISTLSSKLMKQAFEKGVNWIKGTDKDDDEGIGPSVECALGGCTDITNLWEPANIFKDLRTVDLTTVENWTFLEDFAICPPQQDYRALDNCVVDSNLMLAISNQSTLRESIEAGLLDGDVPIVGPNNPENEKKDCFKSGLCYRDLVKLRKANIFPVGMEMAAQRVADKAVTIEEVIDCFEDGGDCEYGIDPNYDNHHNPFYHLVDPDWVLRAPPTRCNAMVYGPAMESADSGSRQRYCADPQVCLREDESGECLEDHYGYCTRSENIWRFNGDMCEDGDVYSGCVTFEHEQLGTESYIEGTLEYCTADDSGCKRYSQTRNVAGEWFMEEDMTLDPALFTLNEDDLFLNTSDCSSSYGGCSEYIALVPDLGVNILPNGSFNDFNDDGFPDGWFNIGIPGPSNGFDADYDGNKIANGYAWGASSYADSEPVSIKVNLLPNTMYVLSMDAAQYVAPADYGVRAAVTLCDTTGDCANTSASNPVPGVGTCLHGAGGHPMNTDLRFVPPADYSWARAGCTFMTDEDIGFAHVTVMSYGGNNAGGALNSAMWMDNVKLEIISDASFNSTPYSEYGFGGTIYMNGDRTMCVEDEVGCQAYTPITGGPMIPAVISQDDLCPNECVGYATFAEQTTIFDVIEGDTTVDYHNFIPETAESCPAADIGCEEFTNLDEVAEGGEGREYYIYLRQCVAEELGLTFYTWEGQDVSGYQIKTWHVLESNMALPSPPFLAPSRGNPPCTNVERGGINCLDTAANIAFCGDDTPADPTDDPDVNPNCRQFFDTTNNDSYWLLQDRVIFASNDCHTYRRSLTGALYSAIPDLSEECDRSSGGCRAYKGNTGNNLRTIFNSQFEGGTYDPYYTLTGTLDISNESVMNNGHSLKLELVAASGDVRRDVSDLVQANREYELSWWMRNESNITTFLTSVSSMATSTVVFNSNNIEGGDWRNYTVDISEEDILNFDFSGVELSFIANGVGNIYFDNIALREVTDHIYVKKGTWSTPAICDNPYAGFHLGCQTYVDRNAQLYNLKSFDKLCGEDKIGCIAVIDVHNSTNPFEETFNLDVPPEPSEITIPEDSIDYLVPSPAKYCPKQFKGCSELGLPEVDKANGNIITGFDTVYKFNDPDRYEDTLCLSEALDCETYASDKGTYYFKDPGNKTCTFRINTHVRLISGEYVPFTGWFQTHTLEEGTDPVGCTDNGDFNFEETDFEYAPYIPLLREEHWPAQCPSTANLCTTFKDPFDPPGCDPRIQPEKSFACIGIDGEVIEGLDAPAQCAALIFNGVATEAVFGEACHEYHYYDNQNIDYKSCVSVDRNSGCMLFYDTNDWGSGHIAVDTLYNASTTYMENVYFDKPVSPELCSNGDVGCNANTIIKVNKSRQCAEWLACKSSSSEFNPETQQYDVLCDDISSCTEYDKRGSVTKCATWDTYTSSTPLMTSVYQFRVSGDNSHLQWADKDYIGFSAPNMLPAKDLEVYNFGNIDSPDLRLMYRVPNSTTTSCETGVYTPSGTPVTDGQHCMAFPEHGISHMGYYQWINTGICKDELCWLGPDYTNQSYYVELTTKGYSAADAPFPQSVDKFSGNTIAGRAINERRPGYSEASVCMGKAANDTNIAAGSCVDADGNGYCDGWEDGCEPSFNKVTYGNGTYTAFWPKDEEYHAGVCVSVLSDVNGIAWNEAYEIIEPDGSSTYVTSPYIGSPCNRNHHCDGDILRNQGHGGKCESVTKVETNLNLPGICYEQDKYSATVSDKDVRAKYCNLWYPITKINTTQGLYNNYDSAGYTDPYGNYVQMCAITSAYMTPIDRYYCHQSGDNGPDGNCELLIRVPAGSYINVHALDNPAWPALSDLLTNYYLKDVYTRYESADIPPGLAVPLGMPIVVTNDGINHINDNGGGGQPIVDSRSMFEATDFYSAPAANYGVDINDIRRLYTEPTGETFEYYFLDEGVSPGVGWGDFQITMPSAVIGAGPCGANYHRVDTAPQIICNPMDYNMYVYGGDIPYPLYTWDRTSLLNCFANVNGRGCYARCNRLLEIDPLGDNVAVRTDVWWASRPENYDYVITTSTAPNWTFWHGSPSSSPIYLDNRSTYLASSDDIYPAINRPSWWSELHYDRILIPTTTPPFVNEGRDTLSIGYAFGAAVSPTSKLGTSEQVELMVPLEPFLSNPSDRLVTTMTPGPVVNPNTESSIRCVGTYCHFYRWGLTRENLSYLFRRVYWMRMLSASISTYGAGGTGYWDATTDTDTARPEVGNSYSLPRVLRVCGNGLCYDVSGAPEEGFTINNSNGGSIVGQGGSLFAAVKFYYHAHPDHMPIRNLLMDWGDGAGPNGYAGKYKNNLPVCNPEEDVPGILNSWQGFGGTEGACHEGYKVLYHQYLYDAAFPCDGAAVNINGTLYNKPNEADSSCFMPIIEVVDNWITPTTIMEYGDWVQVRKD